MALQLSDLFFWRNAVNRTGLPNIDGDELAALIAATIPGGGGNIGLGALLQVGVLSIPNASITPIDFTTGSVIFDDFGMFDIAQPTRLTIPSGENITRAVVYMNVQYGSNAVGFRKITDEFNGGSSPTGGIIQNMNAVSGSGSELNGVSMSRVVSAGDFYEANTVQTSGGNLSIVRCDFGVWVTKN